MIETPLRLHETTVRPEWVDYNRHMSESAYLLVVGDNADAFFRHFGIDDAYRASGGSLFTAETHLHHLRESVEGDHLLFTLQVLGVDSKRVHIVHEMIRPDGELVATAEQMLLHVDTSSGRVSPIPETLLSRLRAIRDAHSALPVPDYVGHVMSLPTS
jgi:acyl-CoA thioesterase FadM